MEKVDVQKLLQYYKEKSMSFSEFIEEFLENPRAHLHTSSTLIYEAINHFGYKIVIRSGEPTLSYNIFEDPFSNGTTAIFGQEFAIKHLVDVIESIGKESGPNRGIVLVGPPASGKTNIIDLISMALEVYSKEEKVKLYTFYFHITDQKGMELEIRSSFNHNPILLLPTILKRNGVISHPRQELFDAINASRFVKDKITIPTYYQNATLDKLSLDILKSLINNPRNASKSLFNILEEYVHVEKIDFASAQANGIANIDDMSNLSVKAQPLNLSSEYDHLLSDHLPGTHLYQYSGAMVSANRGLLHIHDSFGITKNNMPVESEYKPLLMLLGSGKTSVEATQTHIDTTVMLTTNIEEMKILDNQLTASKLLDRIDKIAVNYLLDANSEMDILRRDLSNMREKYDIDPNLVKIAAYYAVMTRLLPPMKPKRMANWSEEKKDLYASITPEQKMFIYSSQPDDPVSTIQRLPSWHSFHNMAVKLGINIHDPGTFEHLISKRDKGIFLDEIGIFSQDQLKLIDDDFMRELWNEYHVEEGKHGISVRQLQNIMRNTIARSDGRSVNVGIFFSQIDKMFTEGPAIHHWLTIDPKYKDSRKPVHSRKLGNLELAQGEGDYGDFIGLAKVAKYLYYHIISKEITLCTVDRDPEEVAYDLRKYIQHSLLANAVENKAFSHILIPKYTFIDPKNGEKVDRPDFNFLISIESVLVADQEPSSFRHETAQRFLNLLENGELKLEEGKSVINSRDDNLLICFGREYSTLLSHRRSVEGLSTEQLRDAFFHMQNSTEKYKSYQPEIRELAESILENMVKRFGYSHQIALGTIVYALRKSVIDFSQIIL
ncbi:MAG: hypothetical protein JW969_19905 [Spirochaetales bacterium]|nr:hypothetical protein [Spirochaetales bacterium]